MSSFPASFRQPYPAESGGQWQYGGSYSIFVHAGVVLQTAVQELDHQIKLLMLKDRSVRADMIAQLLGQGQSSHTTLQGSQDSRENLMLEKNLLFTGLWEKWSLANVRTFSREFTRYTEYLGNTLILHRESLYTFNSYLVFNWILV